MATIKTQLVDGQRSIITKVVDGQRRVSCSCCEETVVCQPYLASMLNIGYIDADLPTTLILKVPIFFSYPVEFVNVPATRSGTIWTGETITQPIIGEYTPTLFLGSEAGTGDPIWESNYGNESIVLLYTPSGIDDDYGSAPWRDEYLDTYSVTTSGGSFNITRDSLCVWTGYDQNFNGGTNVTLRLHTPSASRARENLWTMAGNGRTDGGPYNSPVGTYSNGTYTWNVN